MEKEYWKKIQWITLFVFALMAFGIVVSISGVTAQTNTSVGSLPVCGDFYTPRGVNSVGVYVPPAGGDSASAQVSLQFEKASDSDGQDLNEGFGPGIKGYTLYIDDDKEVVPEAGDQRNFQSFVTEVTNYAGFTVGGTTLDAPAGTLSFVIPTNLSLNTRYYWAFEVVDDEGSRRLCPAREPNTFLTVSDPAQGIIEGTSFEYPTETILYDARIFTNPPPGFTDERFTLPRTLEGVAN